MAKTVDSFLDSQPNPDNRDIFVALQDAMAAYDGDLECKTAWLGIGWKKQSNYLCVATPYKDHVKLMIMRGTLLEDPKQQLEGTGQNTRHIKYFKTTDIDTKYLYDLLDQQATLYASGMKWEG